MGHKNKRTILFRGKDLGRQARQNGVDKRGFRGVRKRIETMFLVGILVVPIVGNMLTGLDVWADEEEKYCKDAVFTPDISNSNVKSYTIRVCAGKRNGALFLASSTKTTIKFDKLEIKTEMKGSSGYWIDFGANGGGTDGSPDDYDDDGTTNKKGDTSDRGMKIGRSGHQFNIEGFSSAKEFVDEVIKHIIYWTKKDGKPTNSTKTWYQDMIISKGSSGGTRIKTGSCAVGNSTTTGADCPPTTVTAAGVTQSDLAQHNFTEDQCRVEPGGEFSGQKAYNVMCGGEPGYKAQYSVSTKDVDDAATQRAIDTAPESARNGGEDTNNENAGNDPNSDPGNNPNNGEDTVETKPDCYSNGGPLAWIICPVLEAVGSMLEWLYTNYVEPMMKINSSMFDREGAGKATYNAWGTFQGFANIIFVIFMLVVIISQVTGVGISNLGIKRVLPRLIIAILLINLSYFICSIAVDISNILGVSLNELFKSLAGNVDEFVVMAEGGGNYASADPVKIAVGEGTRVVAVVGGVAIGIAALGGLGLVITLLLSLISALVSVGVFFVLLSARQAAIVILVVISPIVVVLYTLPNTQKTFDKYIRLFGTMLMLYPICGTIMGAGEFAARLYLNVAEHSSMNACVALLIDVLPFLLIPNLTRKAMDGIAGLGTMATNWGNRTGGRLTNAIRNAESVQRALENSRKGVNRNGEHTMTGKLREKYGKTGLLGSRSMRRRVAAGKKIAEQRASENSEWEAMQENGGAATAYKAARNIGSNQARLQTDDRNYMADDTIAAMRLEQGLDANASKYEGIKSEMGEDIRFKEGGYDGRQAAINRAKLGAAGRVAGNRRVADPRAFEAMLTNVASKEDRDTVDSLVSAIVNNSDLDNMSEAEKTEFFVDFMTKNGEQGVQAVAMSANDNTRDSVVKALKQVTAQHELGRDENGNMLLNESGEAVMRRFYQGASGNASLQKLMSVKNFTENSKYAGKAGASASISDFAVDAQYEDADGSIRSTTAAVEFAQRLSAADIDKMSGGEIEGLIRAVRNGGYAGDPGELSTKLQRYLGTEKGQNSGKFELLSRLQNEAQTATRRREIVATMGTDQAFQVRTTDGRTLNLGGFEGGNTPEALAKDTNALVKLSNDRTIAAGDQAMLASIAGQKILENPSSLEHMSSAEKESAIRTAAPTIAAATSQQFSRVAGTSGVMEAIRTNETAIKNLTPQNRDACVSTMADQISGGTEASARMGASVIKGMSSDSTVIKGLNAEIASKAVAEGGATLDANDRTALANGVSSNFTTMSAEAQRGFVAAGSATSSVSDEGRAEVRRVVNTVVGNGTIKAAAPEAREQVVQQKLADLSNVSHDDFSTISSLSGLSSSTVTELAAGASVGQVQKLVSNWSGDSYTPTTQDRTMAQALVKAGNLPEDATGAAGFTDAQVHRIVEVSGLEESVANEAIRATRQQNAVARAEAADLETRIREIDSSTDYASDGERVAAKRQVMAEAGAAVVAQRIAGGGGGDIDAKLVVEMARTSTQDAEVIARAAGRSGDSGINYALATDAVVQQRLKDSGALRTILDEKSDHKATELKQRRDADYDEHYRSPAESYEHAERRADEIASTVPGASGNYSGVRSPFGPRIGGPGPGGGPMPGPGPGGPGAGI